MTKNAKYPYTTEWAKARRAEIEDDPLNSVEQKELLDLLIRKLGAQPVKIEPCGKCGRNRIA